MLPSTPSEMPRKKEKKKKKKTILNEYFKNIFVIINPKISIYNNIHNFLVYFLVELAIKACMKPIS
jgi:hypothetical protein